MAGDFSVIVDPNIWKQLKNYYDDTMLLHNYKKYCNLQKYVYFRTKIYTIMKCVFGFNG